MQDDFNQDISSCRWNKLSWFSGDTMQERS